MASTINASTSGGGGVIITPDSSGVLDLQSGNTTVASVSSTGMSVTGTISNSVGTLYPLTLATAQTASSTSVNFTGIPSWVNRITLMFSGVSTSGTSNYLIQLGDAGGIENTGYLTAANYSTGSAAATTAGFNILYGIAAAAALVSGSATFTKLTGNTWVMSGNFNDDSQRNSSSSGSKTLSDTLTQLRVTTLNGTDTFDAGTINILYE